MTGAEHYVAAERLAEQAMAIPSENDETNPAAMALLAAAQVHATLALAAATALQVPDGETAGMALVDLEQWEVAASAAEPTGGA